MSNINRNHIAQTGQIPDGLQLFQDDYPLEIVDTKKSITESASGNKIPIMRLTGVFQRADEKNANGRIYPANVLKQAIGDMQEAVKNRRVLGEYDHPCILSSTLCNARVLTTSGWKLYDQVKVGDYVYSRVNGQMIPSRVNVVIDEDYDGPAYIFKGRHIDIGLTAPHKIILDTRSDSGHESKQIEITADELYKNRKQYNRCRIPRVAEWIGEDKEVFNINGIKNGCGYKSDDLQINTKAFVSFLGLYLAEGFVASNPDSEMIEICQKKEDFKPFIREMLFNFVPGMIWVENDRGFHTQDARLANYLRQLGNKYTKYIPENVKQLDGKYLEELVYWFQLGDGRTKHGRSNVFSVSERLIDDLHECWVKAGHCCYRTTIITEDDYEFAGRIIKAENKKPLHQLTLSYTNGIYCDERFMQIEKININDHIWCLTTEHGSFYMENKGCSFWTGNCDAKIHMERVSHLITKLFMEGKVVYGEIEVINDKRCPFGSQLACLMDRKVQVGISSRGVGDMEMTECDGEDAYIVSQGFSFVTFDAVAEPSVKGTQLEKINESLVRNVSKRRLKQIREHLLREEISKLFR